MNKLVLIFLAVVAVAYAVEDCFDTEKVKEGWEDIRTQCSTAIAAGTEDREKKIWGCMMKKAGFLSDDGVLDYDKLREEHVKLQARDISHELEEMDKCWAEANHVPGVFIDLWQPKAEELCPDTKKWKPQ